MTKLKLIHEFSQWLNKYSALTMMHSYEFAEEEINKLLKTEADGYALFEDNHIFVGSYMYSFIVSSLFSNDEKEHIFSFEAIGIGAKENVIGSDYDLADYMEHTYIIK